MISTAIQKLILNQDYKLYPDFDRILIGPSKQNEKGNFYVPIHPIHAMLFSLFTGEKKLKQSIEDVASFFSISEEDAVRLISPFVENEKNLVVEYDRNRFIFPEKILVQTDHEIRTDLDILKYDIEVPLNFTRRRLSIPKTIIFVINTNCATDCIYCYADKCTRYKPLATERILSIIDEAYRIGVKDFDISGGEFFLHKDWKAIVKRAIDYGFTSELSTKVPISNEVIDSFEEVGLKELQISLDSINSGVLKKTLNVGNEYCDKMLNTIKYLDSKGISLIIKGTQTRETCDIDNIKEIMDFLKQLKHVKKYLISIVGYSHFKTVEQFNQFKLTKDQIISLGVFLEEQKSSVPYELVYDRNVQHKSQLCNYKEFKGRALCTANVDGFILLPDGKVTICEELYWNESFILGDLSNKSIIDLWQSDRALAIWDIQQSNLPDNNPCKKCQDFEGCRKGLGVCWKSVIAHYGKDNYLFPDPTCPKAPEPLYHVYYEDF